MDVRRWLEEITIPKTEKAHSTHEHRFRGQSIDSSVIQPATATRTAKTRITRTKRQKEPETYVDSLRDTMDDNEASETSSDTSADRYDRKPRRKTKNDRYHPQNSIDNGHHRGKERKAKKSKKNPKEKNNGKKRKRDKAGIGTVQNFHAKNIAKERLTLRAVDHLGFFGRGKASSPTKGRGLPDLVFSEMKFLQKRKEPLVAEDEVHGEAKRAKKKHPVRGDQEDISAFFATKTLRDSENKVECASVARGDTSGSTQEMTSREQIRATIELPEVPFLGFGSRGTHPTNSSSISWSESVRHPSVRSSENRHETAFFKDQVNQVMDEASTKTMNTRDESKRQAELSGRRAKCLSHSESKASISRAQSEPARRVQGHHDGHLDELSKVLVLGSQRIFPPIKNRCFPEASHSSKVVNNISEEEESAHRNASPYTGGMNHGEPVSENSNVILSSLGQLLQACATAVRVEVNDSVDPTIRRSMRSCGSPHQTTGTGRLPSMYGGSPGLLDFQLPASQLSSHTNVQVDDSHVLADTDEWFLGNYEPSENQRTTRGSVHDDASQNFKIHEPFLDEESILGCVSASAAKAQTMGFDGADIDEKCGTKNNGEDLLGFWRPRKLY